MSNTDGVVGNIKNKPKEVPQKKIISLKPLHKQFTQKFITLSLTLVAIFGLIFVYFHHNNVLIATQLTPLEQELKEIRMLQKADMFVADLLVEGNAEKFVSLQSKLISINRQLLQESSLNVDIYQQWLNESELAEDIVSRIQSSHTRNQQLKQSSLIQLQLMIASITPIINLKLSRQTEYQAEQLKKISTFEKVNDYLTSVQEISDLQQLKLLLVDVVVGFEQLTMNTRLASFEQLRLKIERIVFLYNKVQSINTTKELNDFERLYNTFKKIVLTEQMALAKWQGYLRLSQDYQTDLRNQQQNIRQLVLTSHTSTQVLEKGIVQELINKLGIKLSTKEINIVLIAVFCFLLLFFFYLLWKLRVKIKKSAQDGVEIIEHNMQKNNENLIANCVETQEIMNYVLGLAKPKHNECEFQRLSEKYKTNQGLLTQHEQTISKLKQCNEQMCIDSKRQYNNQRSDELNRYQLLNASLLANIQHYQFNAFHQKAIIDNAALSGLSQLTLLQERLALFYLSLEMKQEKSVLQLTDINLIDEIHAIIFNKQQEQEVYDNQFITSFDEHLCKEVTIDLRIFQQLISLFIDISLSDNKAASLHFHVQLQDKNIGQQLVHISAKVKAKSVNVLPDLIAQLIESQATGAVLSPLIEAFNVLFSKQNGENIVAQLIDEGYQVSFELPLAVVNSENKLDKVTIENTNNVLLSNNNALADLIEKVIVSATGQFKRLARIDSFHQIISEKYLSQQKIDVLIVASDMAVEHLAFINQQIDKLPSSLQPKLMVLQSKELSYECFGFYSQSEQMFCEESFLQTIIKLLDNNSLNNKLLPEEDFIANQYIVTELPVLLAVQSPQKYHNLQRLLLWLGLKVKVVAHEALQQALWKTGQYSLLLTEFKESALLEMERKPIADIGVFSLNDAFPAQDNSSSFGHWHIETLTDESTLTELISALKPWLKPQVLSVNENKVHTVKKKQNCPIETLDEFIITEAINESLEDKSKVVFDFSQYLKNQGTVELALFMLDEYTQDSHQQLNVLIDAIKSKDIEQAKNAISALALNAKILSAKELQSLCTQWLKLLSGSDSSSNLDTINILFNETRIALKEIDEYAETI